MKERTSCWKKYHNAIFCKIFLQGLTSDTFSESVSYKYPDNQPRKKKSKTKGFTFHEILNAMF